MSRHAAPFRRSCSRWERSQTMVASPLNACAPDPCPGWKRVAVRYRAQQAAGLLQHVRAVPGPEARVDHESGALADDDADVRHERHAAVVDDVHATATSTGSPWTSGAGAEAISPRRPQDRPARRRRGSHPREGRRRLVAARGERAGRGGPERRPPPLRLARLTHGGAPRALPRPARRASVPRRRRGARRAVRSHRVRPQLREVGRRGAGHRRPRGRRAAAVPPHPHDARCSTASPPRTGRGRPLARGQVAAHREPGRGRRVSRGSPGRRRARPRPPGRGARTAC